MEHPHGNAVNSSQFKTKETLLDELAGLDAQLAALAAQHGVVIDKVADEPYMYSDLGRQVESLLRQKAEIGRAIKSIYRAESAANNVVDLSAYRALRSKR